MLISNEKLADSKIFVAGHCGLVGSAITRQLRKRGAKHLILKTRSELDLRDQRAVKTMCEIERPDFIFLAAAKVGGIHANDRFRGDFILDNLLVQTNVIHAAFESDVKKLLFLGSSCIYPKFAPQPIPESALLTGPLEYTNEAYAVAKIAGIMLCKSLMLQYGRSFISIMPTNLYGPGDNYDADNSHVIPGLLRKFHEAKVNKLPRVDVWGTGVAIREFLYVDDLAAAAIFCLQNYQEAEHLNAGSGQEVSIRDLANLMKSVVGFEGEIKWDFSKPDGTPRKLMDSSKLMKMGWSPTVELRKGLEITYQDFQSR